MRSLSVVRLGLLLTAACRADAGSGTSDLAATSPTVMTASAGEGAAALSPQAGAGASLPSAAAGSSGAQASSAAGQTGASGAGGTPAFVPAAGAGAAAGSGSPSSSTMTALVPNPSSCPTPPVGATLAAIDALSAVNTLRIAAGAACVNLDLTIGKAAAAHCAYYAMNKGADPMCTDNPHYEVMGCAGFTGAGPVDRMQAAGFVSNGGGEVMAFLNDPLGAVQMWIDSVWHRIPILDPGTVILGYGAADGCDTIDFGPHNAADASRVVVYPYDGQLGVTTMFDGRNEGPMPPAPATGWPSANPISLYAQGLTVTEHLLFVDGDSTPLDHTWLDPLSPALTDQQKRMLRNVVFMYGNAPFLPYTTYRVRMSGTYAGGVLAKEWTFTTGTDVPGF